MACTKALGAMAVNRTTNVSKPACGQAQGGDGVLDGHVDRQVGPDLTPAKRPASARRARSHDEAGAGFLGPAAAERPALPVEHGHHIAGFVPGTTAPQRNAVGHWLYMQAATGKIQGDGTS